MKLDAICVAVSIWHFLLRELLHTLRVLSGLIMAPVTVHGFRLRQFTRADQ
jgi:hypothetical protein